MSEIMIHNRGSVLQKAAIFEPHQPRHPPGKLDVMRRYQGADALLADRSQEFAVNLIRCPGIKIPGRLVSQEQLRPIGQSAGNGHALLLAARQFGGTVVETLAEAEALQQFAGAAPGGGFVGAGDQLRHHHILEGGEFRQQMMELIDKADADATDAGARGIIKLGAVLSGDENFARARRFEQACNMQQR